jgi:hypothetical protein
MKKIRTGQIFTDIRFWIFVFFLIRLVGITHAPLEVGHNWRQCLTNMVARNFLIHGAHLLYPMIDMAGEKTGIIGSEFPLFNYLIYLVSSVFGYSHWYGRLINLSVSSLGLYYFYKLAEKLFNKRMAFNSTMVLATSIWFTFSRKIMPDTFSVSLVIIGLFFAYNYLENSKKSNLIPFFVFCTLGMLCKIPSLSLFSAIAIPVFVKNVDVRKKAALALVGAVSFAIASLWYFYWVPHLVETYRYQLYFPKGIIEGMQEIIPQLPNYLKKFYFSSLKSYLAFTCAVVGVVFLIRDKQKIAAVGMGFIALIFLLFTLKTGAIFPTHNYYIIPFTPVMALLAGYFISRIPIKYQYILLCLIATEGILNQKHDFFVQENQLYKLELEEITEEYIPAGDLIVINGGPSPQDIYFSNRKGWTVTNEAILDAAYLNALIDLGAQYLILDLSDLPRHPKQYPMIFMDTHYAIYQLEASGNLQ